MIRRVMAVVMALTLVFLGASLAAAEGMGYSLRGADIGFGLKPTPGPPSSGVVAADALIGRPIGLATTIAGTAIFIATLPMSLSSGSTSEAAHGLVGQPGGWTFVRPFGRSEPRFEERRIFP